MTGRRMGLAGATLAVLISGAAPLWVPGPLLAADDGSSFLEDKLGGLVPGLLAEHKVPGAAVVVIESGRTLVRGYGLRHAKGSETIGPDTVFEAASLGKPLFAYAMMKLAADGRLDLDRPLAESLDEPFAEDHERLGRITARHVLAHTTGFPNWRPGRFSDQPKPLRIQYEPGSAFGYSGEGYMYLQAVVRQEGGEVLEPFMQNNLLGPLGMTRSGYLWSDQFDPDFATPHGYWGQAGKKWRPGEAGAAYSLHSSAADFARFLQAMLADDDLIAEAMLAPQITLPEDRRFAWSLGWGLERRPDGDWFWHWGDNGDFKHFVMGSRTQERAILVLTNARRGAHVYRAITEAVLGFLPHALELDFISY